MWGLIGCDNFIRHKSGCCSFILRWTCEQCLPRAALHVTSRILSLPFLFKASGPFSDMISPFPLTIHYSSLKGTYCSSDCCSCHWIKTSRPSQDQPHVRSDHVYLPVTSSQWHSSSTRTQCTAHIQLWQIRVKPFLILINPVDCRGSRWAHFKAQKTQVLINDNHFLYFPFMSGEVIYCSTAEEGEIPVSVLNRGNPQQINKANPLTW